MGADGVDTCVDKDDHLEDASSLGYCILHVIAYEAPTHSIESIMLPNDGLLAKQCFAQHWSI